MRFGWNAPGPKNVLTRVCDVVGGNSKDISRPAVSRVSRERWTYYGKLLYYVYEDESPRPHHSAGVILFSAQFRCGQIGTVWIDDGVSWTFRPTSWWTVNSDSDVANSLATRKNSILELESGHILLKNTRSIHSSNRCTFHYPTAPKSGVAICPGRPILQGNRVRS